MILFIIDYLLNLSWMLAAACFPAPIARITVAAPVTASPPANTLSLVVSKVSSLTTKQPHLFASKPSVVVLRSGFGLVPIDMITVSTSISKLLPSMARGRRRPEASASPSSILTHL